MTRGPLVSLAVVYLAAVAYLFAVYPPQAATIFAVSMAFCIGLLYLITEAAHRTPKEKDSGEYYEIEKYFGGSVIEDKIQLPPDSSPEVKSYDDDLT